jgi:hypothetical protein
MIPQRCRRRAKNSRCTMLHDFADVTSLHRNTHKIKAPAHRTVHHLHHHLPALAFISQLEKRRRLQLLFPKMLETILATTMFNMVPSFFDPLSIDHAPCHKAKKPRVEQVKKLALDDVPTNVPAKKTPVCLTTCAALLIGKSRLPMAMTAVKNPRPKQRAVAAWAA